MMSVMATIASCDGLTDLTELKSLEWEQREYHETRLEKEANPQIRVGKGRMTSTVEEI
jgi:hypothetical protein